MENASKALIIAGAILLAILIISLGIMIYNQAAGVVEKNAMNEVEISTFNQKFTQYEGTNVKGPQVNALLNQVIQNNVSTQDDKSKLVTVEVKNCILEANAAHPNVTWQKSDSVPSKMAPTSSTDIGKALAGRTYKVECKTNSKTGLVYEITITANT